MHNLFSGAKSCYVSFRELYILSMDSMKNDPLFPLVFPVVFPLGWGEGWADPSRFPIVLGSLNPLVSSLASPLAGPIGLSSNDAEAGGHRHHCFYGGLRGAKLYMLIYDETYLYCHIVYINISNSECTAVQCVFFIVHYIMIFDIY